MPYLYLRLLRRAILIKRRFIPACVLSLLVQAGAAQTAFTGESLKYTPTAPPLPEASSLGKFGQTPVSLYTGIPQISIPIYTLKLHNVELPVSLDYHAGGIRVSEIASTVGLGWALQAGGMISSTSVGQADFSERGYVRGWNEQYRIPADRMLRPLVIDRARRITNVDYEFAMRATACSHVDTNGVFTPFVGRRPILFCGHDRRNIRPASFRHS